MSIEILLDRIQSLAAQVERQSMTIEAQSKTIANFEHVANNMVPTPSVDDVIAMVAFMADGKKLEGIKLYRKLTSYGLKESKDAIEAVMNRFAQP